MHEVPQTILEQLGGRQFLMMTGAKDLVGASDHLWMRIAGRCGGRSVNRVKVTLRGDDTYTLETFYMRNSHCKLIGQSHGVYVDSLAETFERLTGLYTRLSTVRFLKRAG